MSKNTNDSVYDIFNLLKEIKISETNDQLESYFSFVKFYGLLDPKNVERFEQIENQVNKKNKVFAFGFGITLISSYLFYKKNFKKVSYYTFIFGALTSLYIDNQSYQEINFELLQMKDEYINKVDTFFKEDKNPLILNPNFLSEELIEPSLNKYQEFLKMKL